ncbi:hypothetical protein P7K49_024115 [Saguinus oedipus]|uniref:Uncharacterized protein n=1 Tax=Saguinus oedipus TaxID=9490 RepID=A0ABQ9UPE2_SAGOE|nr:hypothetical protein P7K49_024115 [Saguinus oedipus]
MVVATITVFIMALGTRNCQGQVSSGTQVKKRIEDKKRFDLIPSTDLPKTSIPWDQVVLKRVVFDATEIYWKVDFQAHPVLMYILQLNEKLQRHGPSEDSFKFS